MQRGDINPQMLSRSYDRHTSNNFRETGQLAPIAQRIARHFYHVDPEAWSRWGSEAF